MALRALMSVWPRVCLLRKRFRPSRSARASRPRLPVRSRVPAGLGVVEDLPAVEEVAEEEVRAKVLLVRDRKYTTYKEGSLAEKERT